MTARNAFNTLVALLLISGALAGDFTGEYRLVSVELDKDKSLRYPTSRKIKIIEEDSKYFMVADEPMITITGGEGVELPNELKNEIVFSKSKRSFQIIFTIVGEDSIYTYIYRGFLDENASNFECRGVFLSSSGDEGKFIISE